MKISKSKRQLAQLLIEAGVTQFPEGANWAAQDGDAGRVFYYSSNPSIGKGCKAWAGGVGRLIACKLSSKPLPNWHQTVLSRDEFDQIVVEVLWPVEPQPVTRSISELTTTPTLDQLLQDWRNADDYAQRKQTEADEAAAMRDTRWKAVQARAGEMGVTVERCESELVITCWRDLQIGDEIESVIPNGGRVTAGERGVITELDCDGFSSDFPSQKDYWYSEEHFDRGDVKFIRRP